MYVDSQNRLRLSPGDLSAFLVCRHRSGLDLAVARGVLAKPVRNSPVLNALREHGAEHERAYVAHLRAAGLSVVDIPADRDVESRAAATHRAMRSGVD